MTSVNSRLLKIVKKIQRPTEFCVIGSREIYTPRIEVEGVGQLSFPLLASQAEQLIAKAESAPYGKGEQTLVDTNVRRTWQINKEQVNIEGRYWKKDIQSILDEIIQCLGLNNKVIADLYKLLIYDKGSFFVPHRDTEKQQGMFATLVIVLPSNYRGGELTVRHLEQEVNIDLCREEPFEIAFAAFYADCSHEVKPITEGYRLTLIYNLISTNQKKLIQVPDYLKEQQQLAKLFTLWRENLKKLEDNDSLQCPRKLIYPLEHAYTPEALDFESLKSVDAVIAQTFQKAAQQTNCEIYLALLSFEESGTAEHCGYRGYGGYRSTYDDSDFEVDEVFDQSAIIYNWVAPKRQLEQGMSFPLTELPFEANELCPENAFDDIEPDELEFQEATGNEGASFERSYHRAVLVVWPSERRIEIVNQGGLGQTLPYLKELVKRWKASGKKPDAILRQEARQLTQLMLESWPKKHQGFHYSDQQGTVVSQFLETLHQLEDVDFIESAIVKLCVDDGYHHEFTDGLLRAAELLPLKRVVELIEQIIVENAAKKPSSTIRLLSSLTHAKYFRNTIEHFKPSAELLINHLPKELGKRSYSVNPYGKESINETLLIDLLKVLICIDQGMILDALDNFFNLPKIYPVDKVLLPSAIYFVQEDFVLPELIPLISRVKVHLETRISKMPPPPPNWTRASQTGCSCNDCQEFSLFLANPVSANWTFKASEYRRKHIEECIRRRHLDVNYHTTKKGRPYSLICVKNRASYERRLTQHENDVKNLEILKGK